MLDVYDHIMAGNGGKRGLPTSAMSEYFFELDQVHDLPTQGIGQVGDFTAYIREDYHIPHKVINARKESIEKDIRYVENIFCQFKVKKIIYNKTEIKNLCGWLKDILSNMSTNPYLDEEDKIKRRNLKEEIEEFRKLKLGIKSI